MSCTISKGSYIPHGARQAEDAMKTMSATIDIDAPPAEVWAILTDLGAYGEWNPQFVEAGGNVAMGHRITLRSKHPADGRMMTVKPKITAAQPGSELRWVAGLPGIIGGEHSFTLTATGSGTRVVQSETFKGPLTGLFGKTFANAEASFQALNQALKERAETRTNPVS